MLSVRIKYIQVVIFMDKKEIEKMKRQEEEELKDIV